jgi:hypothetical protein
LKVFIILVFVIFHFCVDTYTYVVENSTVESDTSLGIDASLSGILCYLFGWLSGNININCVFLAFFKKKTLQINRTFVRSHGKNKYIHFIQRMAKYIFLYILHCRLDFMVNKNIIITVGVIVVY